MRTIRRYRSRGRRGFTLMEMLLILMYISILAGMVLPHLTGAGRRAAEVNLKATIQALRSAIGAYQAETGLYPTQVSDLVAEEAPETGLTDKGVEVPIHPDDWRGPYLIASGGKIPLDRTTGERNWEYSTTPPTVGAIHSKSAGTSLDGEPYSEY